MKADRDARPEPGGRPVLRPGPARAGHTSSTILMLLIVLLIGFLIYAVWRWMQRTSTAPKAPMHSRLQQAFGSRHQALGA